MNAFFKLFSKKSVVFGLFVVGICGTLFIANQLTKNSEILGLTIEYNEDGSIKAIHTGDWGACGKDENGEYYPMCDSLEIVTLACGKHSVCCETGTSGSQTGKLIGTFCPAQQNENGQYEQVEQCYATLTKQNGVYTDSTQAINCKNTAYDKNLDCQCCKSAPGEECAANADCCGGYSCRPVLGDPNDQFQNVCKNCVDCCEDQGLTECSIDMKLGIEPKSPDCLRAIMDIRYRKTGQLIRVGDVFVDGVLINEGGDQPIEACTLCDVGSASCGNQRLVHLCAECGLLAEDKIATTPGWQIDLLKEYCPCMEGAESHCNTVDGQLYFAQPMYELVSGSQDDTYPNAVYCHLEPGFIGGLGSNDGGNIGGLGSIGTTGVAGGGEGGSTAGNNGGAGGQDSGGTSTEEACVGNCPSSTSSSVFSQGETGGGISSSFGFSFSSSSLSLSSSLSSSPSVHSSSFSFSVDLSSSPGVSSESVSSLSECGGDECAQFGDGFCSAQNQTCVTIQDSPCFTCVEVSSSSIVSSSSSSLSFKFSFPSFSSISSQSSSSISSSSSSSSFLVGICTGAECTDFGNDYCNAGGQDCITTNDDLCFACIDRSSSSSIESSSSSSVGVIVFQSSSVQYAPYCGNGFLDPGEQCDDSNTVDNDGCDAGCQLASGYCTNDIQCGVGRCIAGVCKDPTIVAAASLCGNGILESQEECDDQNTRNNDGCTSTCLLEIGVCGDGVVQKLLGEQCEASLHDPSLPYTCVQCRFNSSLCGNGNLDAGEECDEGQLNSNSPDANCRPNCSRPRCGDGIIDSAELCDDSNTRSGDGCDRFCRTENAVSSQPTTVLGSTITFPTQTTTQPVPFQLPLANLQPLIQQQGPIGDTGPAAVAVIGAGAASGFAWVRRKRRK